MDANNLYVDRPALEHDAVPEKAPEAGKCHECGVRIPVAIYVAQNGRCTCCLMEEAA